MNLQKNIYAGRPYHRNVPHFSDHTVTGCRFMNESAG